MTIVEHAHGELLLPQLPTATTHSGAVGVSNGDVPMKYRLRPYASRETIDIRRAGRGDDRLRAALPDIDLDRNARFYRRRQGQRQERLIRDRLANPAMLLEGFAESRALARGLQRA